MPLTASSFDWTIFQVKGFAVVTKSHLKPAFPALVGALNALLILKM